jgi:hypothetical protein
MLLLVGGGRAVDMAVVEAGALAEIKGSCKSAQIRQQSRSTAATIQRRKTKRNYRKANKKAMRAEKRSVIMAAIFILFRAQ